MAKLQIFYSGHGLRAAVGPVGRPMVAVRSISRPAVSATGTDALQLAHISSSDPIATAYIPAKFVHRIILQLRIS